MRILSCSLVCLLLMGCTPETDLRKAQTAVPPAETTTGSLSSPEPDPLAGQLIEPPSGATELPTNLAFLVISFTEPVQPTGAALPFVLRSATGVEMPLPLGIAVPCPQSCYQLALGVEIPAASLHTLEAVAGGLQFLDGKPVPAGSAGSFATGEAADLFAPRIQAFTAETSAGCLAVHLAVDEPVQVEVVVRGGGQTVVLPAGEFTSVTDSAEPLPAAIPGPAAQVLARVVDRGGNQAESVSLAVVVPPPLPRLVITEILANSAGSETTQEFIEIYNAGAETVALGALVIADKAGSDPLPADSLLPGTFAIVVAEKYDPAEGSDVPPREGTVVVRVAGRLGSDGLSNGGEVVRLLTSAGETISQYGGFVDVGATAWSGKSVKRSSIEACDTASAWTAAPTAATPGW